MKIKNINYKRFIESGQIIYIEEAHLREALGNIKGKHQQEGRALVITLYYTGARPNEVLSLYGEDISKEGAYIKIRLPASKRGLPRIFFIPYKLELAKELYIYSRGIFPKMLLFRNFRNNYIRNSVTKKGVPKQYTSTADKLRYYFSKWFDSVIEGGINPYYLRHNRFSSLSEAGVPLETLRQLKGAKSINSVYPYLHLSSFGSKGAARKLK